MAITKTAADFGNLGSSGSKVEITFGNSITSDAVICNDFLGCTIGCSVDFGGTPDGNVKLEVFTSPNNTNFDDTAFVTFEVPFSANQTVQKTEIVGVDAVKYLKVKVTNLDSADPVDVWAFIVDMTA